MMEIIQSLIDVLAGICAGITSVLPTSPFQSINAVVLDSKILQFIAWLVPFPQIISLLEVWLACVIVFYIFSVVMRWIKLIS